MINTFVVVHLAYAGLQDRTDLICFSRSNLFGATAPQEWMVIPAKDKSGRAVLGSYGAGGWFGCGDFESTEEKSLPPMLEAAIPVLAVTETTAGCFACFSLKAAMMARSSSDFPVPGQRKIRTTGHECERWWRFNTWKKATPAAPVKKTLFPWFTTMSNTPRCSPLSGTDLPSPSSALQERALGGEK